MNIFNEKISLKSQTAILMIMTAMPLTGQAERGGNALTDNAPSVPGELLVQFIPGTTTADKGRALGRVHAEVIDKVVPENNRKDGGGELVLIRHLPDFTPAAARREIEADPAIEFAEPNYIYTHQATSNDTYYTNGSLWGMYSSPTNQYGSQASAAWATEVKPIAAPCMSASLTKGICTNTLILQATPAQIQAKFLTTGSIMTAMAMLTMCTDGTSMAITILYLTEPAMTMALM